MILKHRLLEKYDAYTFRIPVHSRDKVLVKAGDTVTEGADLYIRKGNNAKHSFYIPDQLNCSLDTAIRFITCIDGEFVNEGDVLAEKTSSGGLTVKRLISLSNGIVDLTRIKLGYIDVLGEEQEALIKSNFKAEILDVNPLEGITIKASALALDLLSVSSAERVLLAGEFVTLNMGKDIKLKGEESSYEGKIVFVGKHLHASLLRDLFEKGAKFVLTYSMDYQDFRNQGLPIGLIGGFGEMYSGGNLLGMLSDLNGSYAVIDFDESQIFFLKETKKLNTTESVFVKNLVGSKIVSRTLGSYGMTGEIMGVEGSSYVTVEWEHGGRSVTNIGSLEFVSYQV
ncbi:MAG: hypothetical protein US14_C0035G0003 [candidate division WS6 bacterium GW2011_WS6_36_26]|nr:MAG: hypothetical protein US14_C0035G0003 [candidate division WS6 bacterium GW2011_WS6_36_26]